MKVFVFLADGFEEIEAIVPIDIFRRAELDVVTVSISDFKEVIGAHEITVLADKIFSQTDFSDCGMIFLPGGMPGATNLAKHDGLAKLLKIHGEKQTRIAAICAAPLILGRLGLLEGKEAICFPGFENELIGAVLTGQTVIQSGNVFTAKAAGKATELALLIVGEIKGKALAHQIKEQIFFG